MIHYYHSMIGGAASESVFITVVTSLRVSALCVARSMRTRGGLSWSDRIVCSLSILCTPFFWTRRRSTRCIASLESFIPYLDLHRHITRDTKNTCKNRIDALNRSFNNARWIISFAFQASWAFLLPRGKIFSQINAPIYGRFRHRKHVLAHVVIPRLLYVKSRSHALVRHFES